MPFTDYFPPIPQTAFGVDGFDYDKFKLWLEMQQWNFKKAITIQGDIVSSNWNGAEPLDLSTEDTTASAGFALDSSAGSAQFEGNVFVGGDINVTGTLTVGADASLEANLTMTSAGLIRTASSATRVELGPDGGTHTIKFYGPPGPSFALHGSIYGSSGLQIKANGGDPAMTLDSAGTGTIRVLGTGNTYMDIKANATLFRDGSVSAPGISFLSDTDTGIYRSAANELSFSAGNNQELKIKTDGVYIPTGGKLSFDGGTDTRLVESWGIGFRHGSSAAQVLWSETSVIAGVTTGSGGTNHGAGRFLGDAKSASAPTFSFRADNDTGLYSNQANAVAMTTGGEPRMAWDYQAGSGTGVYMHEDLTDVGNHETLRLDRFGGGSTLREIGYYSSWLNDPVDGHPRKHRVTYLNDQPTRWWKREWFMDLKPLKYERVKGQKAATKFRTRPIELGFHIENLIEHTNLLTTKGSDVGDAPDEYAILAVTVDYVQHLEQRVAELERLVAA